MTIRSISPAELGKFCALNDDGWLEKVLAGLWNGRDGVSKPEWCFLLEDDGKPVGRVFFWHMPSSPRELILMSFHLDLERDSVRVGGGFLSEVLVRMRETGAERVDRHLYDIYSSDPDREREVYEAAGLRCIQDKKRHVWKVTDEPIAVPGRLAFRAMTEAGEDAFVEAVRLVTVDTLDREDRFGIEELGPEEHARRFMATLKDIGFKPDRIQLAYLPDGNLCGLVAPCRIDDEEGAINYIGVVPKQRGNAYGYDLVLKANEVLQPEGHDIVVAETDMHNVALHRHLERAGYEHKGNLWWYRYRYE